MCVYVERAQPQRLGAVHGQWPGTTDMHSIQMLFSLLLRLVKLLLLLLLLLSTGASPSADQRSDKCRVGKGGRLQHVWVFGSRKGAFHHWIAAAMTSSKTLLLLPPPTSNATASTTAIPAKKVGGNFHFAPGKSFQQGNSHVHGNFKRQRSTKSHYSR